MPRTPRRPRDGSGAPVRIATWATQPSADREEALRREGLLLLHVYPLDRLLAVRALQDLVALLCGVGQGLSGRLVPVDGLTQLGIQNVGDPGPLRVVEVVVHGALHLIGESLQPRIELAEGRIVQE